MSKITKVAVIGSGVMGTGIAAQIANSGTEVLLYDIVPEGAEDKNVVAKGAIEKLIKIRPAALMHKDRAKLITPKNLETDLKELKDCDWIVEVIIERLDLKHDLYKKIAKYKNADAIVTSNTSTIPLKELTEGMDPKMEKNFFITHFFNPVRYLRLLEIVTSSKTDKKAVKIISEFADYSLGKTIINCKDTPGFVGNRIGIYWLQCSVIEAFKQGIDVETVDAIHSKPIGVPKTGVFGLIDLVGLDLMPHILKSITGLLSKEDPFLKLGDAPKLVLDMISDGYTGRKGKGGFYTIEKDGEKKIKRVKNLKTGEYDTAKKPKVPAVIAAQKGKLNDMLDHNSAAGKYAWDTIGQTLAYAASLVTEIADDIQTIDEAMKLGFNWKYGPFEIINKLGTEWFANKLHASGKEVPKYIQIANKRPLYKVEHGKQYYLDANGVYQEVKRAKGVLLLSDIKLKSKPIMANSGAKVWDLGDNIACLEFTTKMNAIDPRIFSMINKSLKELPEKGYKGLVIYNDGANFSVGANLAMVIVAAKLFMWPFVKWFIRKGQKTVMDMKYSPMPVVGAPANLALGGGCEILLHCNAVTPYAETYIGLVEAGVGIIPAWGGCKELLGRHATAKVRPGGPMHPVMKAFEPIATAQVATSAMEAIDMKFFADDTEVVMNRDRVLATAKRKAQDMAKNFTPPAQYTYNLPGASGATALELAINDFAARGIATPHDVTVGKTLAYTLTGGKADVLDTLTEEDILKLEREGIIKLSKTKQTKARMMHILKTGKPLRN